MKGFSGVQRFLSGFVVVALVVTAIMASPADAARRKAHTIKKPVDRHGSIVIEADSGYVLSSSNADKQLHPASLTKMMTLYLTFEAIQNGRLTKNQRIPVSKHAALMEPSELGLAAGSTIRVEDAIYGLVTKSANDAAVTLGEAIGGSETAFATIMTRKARQLGMKNTTFKNASGLHVASQVSSARDMAVLGQALIRDFPRDYRYFSTNTFTYAGQTMSNHNHLMKSYAGMDGIKTGYVYASGYNLVASAKRDGTRLIGVIFGGNTSKERNNEMANLLDAGFDKIEEIRARGIPVAAKGQNNVLAQNTAQLKTAALAGTATTAAASQVASAKAARPRFNAIGLVTEQGDADDDGLIDQRQQAAAPVNSFQPRPLNTQPLNAQTLNAPAAMGAQTAEAQALNAQIAPSASNDNAAADGTALQTASAAMAPRGAWSVQVGAFSTHEAGMAALRDAHTRLPPQLTLGRDYVIVPLMTNRGVIYRARVSGMSRDDATDACRRLSGNCLVLAAQ